MKIVNEQEFAGVLALTAPERYSHFIRQVADWEEVWSLRAAEGWVLMGTDDGTEVVPVWPHRRYAEACAKGTWSDAKPEPIALEKWLKAPRRFVSGSREL